MIKKEKEDMMTMQHQVENINRTRNYKKEANGNSGVEKYKNSSEKNHLRVSKVDLNWQKKKLMNFKIY